MTKFWKYQGTGNDFIIVDNRDGHSELNSKYAKRLCDRHFGIGADGIIHIVKSKHADVGMRSMNSDGTVAETCGTGIRCVAKHAYDTGLVKGEEFSIEALSGVRRVRITPENGKAKLIETNMGAPILECADIPMAGEGRFINLPIEADGMTVLGNGISMGSPHLVIFNDLTENERSHLGPKLECSHLFPKRTNVGFATVSEGKMFLRVYERGAGWTLSCGTGACAAAVAGALNGLVPYDEPIDIKLPGGWLTVTVAKGASSVVTTGPAMLVYEGTI